MRFLHNLLFSLDGIIFFGVAHFGVAHIWAPLQNAAIRTYAMRLPFVPN